MATILILDDDKYFRTLAKAALEGRGHSVAEAERCGQADEVLAKSWIDLVLVDGLLPDGMGLDWIARLRQHDTRVAVVFCSSFFRDAEIGTGLTLAATLRKPIAPNVLAAKVEGALRAAGVTQASEPRPVLTELDAAFHQELPVLLTGLRKAIAQLRSDKSNSALRGVARRRAHQLASASGSVCEIALSEACSGIEGGLVSDDWKKIDDGLDIIRHDRRAVA